MNKLKYYAGKIFTSNTSGANWLAILRIGAALSLIGKILSEFRVQGLLYGSSGLVPPDIAVYSQNPYIPTIPGIYRHLHIFSFETSFLKAFFLCQLIFAFLLLLGYMTRFSAFICWLMMVIVFNSSHLTSYGFDAILLTLLFYCLVFPVGNYLSMDKGVSRPDSSLLRIFHKTIQIHVCLIYFVNGISKVHGTGWQDGSGLWDAINQPQFHSLLTPFLQKIFMIPYLPAVVSMSIIFIELAYPFLIWVKGMNRVILVLILLLHAFIGVVMGLWLFAFAMIIFNLAAFGHVLGKQE